MFIGASFRRSSISAHSACKPSRAIQFSQIRSVNALGLDLEHADNVAEVLFGSALAEVLQLFDDHVFRCGKGGLEAGPAGIRTPRASRERSNSESLAMITSTF